MRALGTTPFATRRRVSLRTITLAQELPLDLPLSQDATITTRVVFQVEVEQELPLTLEWDQVADIVFAHARDLDIDQLLPLVLDVVQSAEARVRPQFIDLEWRLRRGRVDRLAGPPDLAVQITPGALRSFVLAMAGNPTATPQAVLQEALKDISLGNGEVVPQVSLSEAEDLRPFLESVGVTPQVKREAGITGHVSVKVAARDFALGDPFTLARATVVVDEPVTMLTIGSAVQLLELGDAIVLPQVKVKR